MADQKLDFTARGRLSFPRLTLAEAIIANAKKTKYKVANDADVKAEFTLNLEEDMKEALRLHMRDVVVPFALARGKAGEETNAFTEAQAEAVLKDLEAEDWAESMTQVPLKNLSDKNQELDPDAVATLKVSGVKGRDIVQKAIVRSQEDMADTHKDRVKFPALVPIAESAHELYPGCVVKATLNPYCYVSGKTPGITFNATVLAWADDADRFGGGVDADTDAMFED